MLWLKYLHMTLATLSISGFTFRVILAFRGSALLQQKVMKVAPHVIDTLLLFTGVILSTFWTTEALQMWLPYKLAALVAYILFGVLTFRFAHTKTQLLCASVLALSSVAYLVGIALYKSPWSWFV